MNEGNMSKNEIKKISRTLRKELGRGVIESGLNQSLLENKEVLEEFFTVKSVKMLAKNEKKEYVEVEKDIFICKNIPKFVAYVMKQREMENCDLKIGVDFGQKFLKICLSLLETNDQDTQLEVGLELAKLEVK